MFIKAKEYEWTRLLRALGPAHVTRQYGPPPRTGIDARIARQYDENATGNLPVKGVQD